MVKVDLGTTDLTAIFLIACFFVGLSSAVFLLRKRSHKEVRALTTKLPPVHRQNHPNRKSVEQAKTTDSSSPMGAGRQRETFKSDLYKNTSQPPKQKSISKTSDSDSKKTSKEPNRLSTVNQTRETVPPSEPVSTALSPEVSDVLETNKQAKPDKLHPFGINVCRWHGGTKQLVAPWQSMEDLLGENRESVRKALPGLTSEQRKEKAICPDVQRQKKVELEKRRRSRATFFMDLCESAKKGFQRVGRLDSIIKSALQMCLNDAETIYLQTSMQIGLIRQPRLDPFWREWIGYNLEALGLARPDRSLLAEELLKLMSHLKEHSSDIRAKQKLDEYYDLNRIHILAVLSKHGLNPSVFEIESEGATLLSPSNLELQMLADYIPTLECSTPDSPFCDVCGALESDCIKLGHN